MFQSRINYIFATDHTLSVNILTLVVGPKKLTLRYKGKKIKYKHEILFDQSYIHKRKGKEIPLSISNTKYKTMVIVFFIKI